MRRMRPIVGLGLFLWLAVLSREVAASPSVAPGGNGPALGEKSRPTTPATEAFLRENRGDVEGARRLYASGCESREPAACSGLGTLEARAGNQPAAIEAFRKGCDLGDGHACHWLSRADNGLDAKERAKRLDSACRLGVSLSCLDQGVEREGEKRAVAARDSFSAACRLGSAEGCLRAGELFDAAGEKEKARSLFESGCRRRHPVACHRFAVHEEKLGRVDEARRAYTTACETSPSVGCNNLGILELRSEKKKEARRLFRRACEQGKDFVGCNSLAVMESRDGNDEEAGRLYRLSCEEGGVPFACRNWAGWWRGKGKAAEAEAAEQRAAALTRDRCVGPGSGPCDTVP